MQEKEVALAKMPETFEQEKAAQLELFLQQIEAMYKKNGDGKFTDGNARNSIAISYNEEKSTYTIFYGIVLGGGKGYRKFIKQYIEFNTLYNSFTIFTQHLDSSDYLGSETTTY